jgi:hypothetical protein
MFMTAHEWDAAAAVLAVAVIGLATATLWYSLRGQRGHGRHVLGRPRFDGDPGGWEAAGPAATLATLPPIDWYAAPLPDMAENHADIYGVPAPKYTELDAWRAEEEAAERLAETSDRAVVIAIVRGLEYRDGIDLDAELILEGLYAQLALIDIGADLS